MTTENIVLNDQAETDLSPYESPYWELPDGMSQSKRALEWRTPCPGSAYREGTSSLDINGNHNLENVKIEVEHKRHKMRKKRI